MSDLNEKIEGREENKKRKNRLRKQRSRKKNTANKNTVNNSNTTSIDINNELHNIQTNLNNREQIIENNNQNLITENRNRSDNRSSDSPTNVPTTPSNIGEETNLNERDENTNLNSNEDQNEEELVEDQNEQLPDISPIYGPQINSNEENNTNYFDNFIQSSFNITNNNNRNSINYYGNLSLLIGKSTPERMETNESSNYFETSINDQIDGINDTFGENLITEKLLNLLRNKEMPPTSLINEINYLSDSNFHPIYKECSEKQVPIYDIANNSIFNFICNQKIPINKWLLTDDSFSLSWMYFLSCVKNRTSNDSLKKFNLKYAETLSNQTIPIKPFLPRCKEFYYCFCFGSYKYFEKIGQICNRCKSKIKKVNSFVMFFLEDMLSILLSDPYLFKMIKTKIDKYKLPSFDNISNTDLLFDISSGLFYRNLIANDYFNLAEICLTSICFIDEVVVNNGMNGKICVVYLAINELDFDVRFKENYIIPIAIFQTRYQHHNSIFTPLITQFQAFLRNKKYVLFHHYSVNEINQIKTETFQKEVKLINIAFTIDKASAVLVLDISSHSGYCSCWTCLIIGKKVGHEAVNFPFEGFDISSARRTDDYAEECERIMKENGLNTFGGQHGLTIFSKLKTFNTFSMFLHDLFHDLILGPLEMLLNQLIETNAVYKSVHVKYTKEVHAHYSSLLYFNEWKGIDNINCLLYSLIPLLLVSKTKTDQNYTDDFIKRWSKLAHIYERINVKNSNFAPSLNELWEIYKDIIEIIKQTELVTGCKVSSKIHSLCHLIFDILKFGLCWNFSSLSFESALAKIKFVARDSKVNAIISVINFVMFSFAQNLFKHLPEEVIDAFGVTEIRKEFLFEYSKEEKKEFKEKKTFLDINNSIIYSYERIMHEGLNHMITINSYSCNKKTNNQFVILKINEQNFVFGKILAIQTENKTVYYNTAILYDQNIMSPLTLGRTFKIKFESEIKTASWNSIIEKVVCFQIDDYYFITRLKK